MIPIAQKTESDSERILMSLPVKVEAQTAQNEFWREISHIEAVTKTSADFYLTRACEAGQLLLLKMPIRKELRRYDTDKEQYCIWGIVRSCSQALRNGLEGYFVSVAFIGQEPPHSFRQNPETIYKLVKLSENGFWQISELRQGPENRRHSRYNIPLEVVIVVCDESDNVIAEEQTVTENISQSGVSVFSDLNLDIGDTVKLIKQHSNFSASAVVRNRRLGKDNLPRLHLEFINARFPLEGIG
jgi:hypothetical protein